MVDRARRYPRFEAVFLVLATVSLTAGCVSRYGVLPAGPPLYAPVADMTPIPSEPYVPVTDDERNTINVFVSREKGVVNLTTKSAGFGRLPIALSRTGIGSGSIIDASGLVLTNFHVVEGADEISVTLHDGTSVQGMLIGADPENDVALVRFDPDGRELTVIPLGSSASVIPGQKTIAIGSPYGLERTVTVGIVSGTRRSLVTENGYIIRDMIQTDAAINPGNSGGPLLDTAGNMIGMNTMIISPAGGSIGLGFGVPVDTVKRILPQLVTGGFVRRGWIDIVPVPVSPRNERRLGVSGVQGILVSQVAPGSPAAKAGLKGGERRRQVAFAGRTVYLGGDIIVSVNGQPTTDFSTYLLALEGTAPGERAVVRVVRGGVPTDIELTLSDRPYYGEG